MASDQTLIWTTVDYDRAGKQIGSLQLPHSVTRSAYGVIPIPVAVIKNGSGPTVLLMAGNHGDEYEGQIALARFIRAVDPAAVQGRIIVLPAINLPAALAGTRVSPLDGGNLNRSFPGEPHLGPTAAIAHYLDRFVFPMCDAMHDFHAGGASLHYLPFASARLSGDPELDRRSVAALKAFAPPLAKLWPGSFDWRVSHAAANARKVVALGGEFGGAGDVSIAGIQLIESGMRRFLAHFEVMELPAQAPPPPATRFVEVGGHEYYVYAPERGICEPLVRLGDDVEAGQPAALIHFVENPAREPVACRFAAGGLVVCRRAMGRCEPGDCLFHLATDTVPPGL
jgi:predicted deacylase